MFEDINIKEGLETAKYLVASDYTPHVYWRVAKTALLLRAQLAAMEEERDFYWSVIMDNCIIYCSNQECLWVGEPNESILEVQGDRRGISCPKCGGHVEYSGKEQWMVGSKKVWKARAEDLEEQLAAVEQRRQHWRNRAHDLAIQLAAAKKEKCAAMPSGIVRDVDGETYCWRQQQLAASKTAMEGMVADVVRLQVASCTCTTKTDEPQYHADYCMYKRICNILAKWREGEVMGEYHEKIKHRMAAKLAGVNNCYKCNCEGCGHTGVCDYDEWQPSPAVPMDLEHIRHGDGGVSRPDTVTVNREWVEKVRCLCDTSDSMYETADEYMPISIRTAWDGQVREFKNALDAVEAGMPKETQDDEG